MTRLPLALLVAMALILGAAKPAACPAPTPRPTAAPTPAPTTASGPLIVTTNDVTIEGRSFTGTKGSGYAIHAVGTAADPVRNLTIRNCTTSGFNVAIWLEHVANVTVENCSIDDAGYAGILALNAIGGRFAGNVIRRVGPQTVWRTGDPEIDAYGIAFEHGALSSDVVVDGNLIEDVPQWQGINAHNGTDLTISNNVVRRVRRAYWFAPTPADSLVSIVVTGNRAEQARSDQPTAYFISDSDNCSITGNSLDTSFPVNADGGEWLNFIRDYLAISRGLVRSGNVRS
jgi:hypothetical protein